MDLKGAVPKLDYLEKVLLLVKEWGVTGVLLEYEDSFPYYGELEALRGTSVFSRDQLMKLLGFCKENSLEVIPLVQTFGHFEVITNR